MKRHGFALAGYVAIPQGDDLLGGAALGLPLHEFEQSNVLKILTVHQDTHDLCVASFQVIIPARD